MSFKQYTRCIEAADFSKRIRYITIASLLAGTPAALIAAAAGHLACLLIALIITLLAGIVAYCHNWLYHRLICLGGDRDCIGTIVRIGEGWDIFDWDTDYTISLLLQGSGYGAKADRAALHAAAEQTTYGELIRPQQSIMAIGLGPLDHGKFEPDPADPKTKWLAAVLHAEFEGDGVYNVLQASKVLLAFAVYALVACLFLPWPADIILAGIIAALSLLGLLLASLLGLFGEGSPSDVNAGELTSNTGFDENGGGDVVYVQGAWVFDTLHDRWNEIHPIKKCCKVGECPEGTILRIRHGFQVAQAEQTITNQARPEYRWQIHPDLDGCVAEVIL